MTRTGSSANTPGGMAFNLLLFRYLESRKLNQLVTVMLQYNGLPTLKKIREDQVMCTFPVLMNQSTGGTYLCMEEYIHMYNASTDISSCDLLCTVLHEWIEYLRHILWHSNFSSNKNCATARAILPGIHNTTPPHIIRWLYMVSWACSLYPHKYIHICTILEYCK